MKKVLSTGVILSILSVSLCFAQELSGQWQTQSDGRTLVLSFPSSNQLVYDGVPYQYSVQQSTMVINVEGQMELYPYWFDNGQLNIYFPEGYTLQFTQTSKSAKTPPPQTQTASNEARSGNTYIMGRLCSYGSSSSYSNYSSYSHSETYYFDGKGNFQYSNESSYSGSAGYAYGGDNSGAQHGTYRISGNMVLVQFSTGQQYNYTIMMVQNDGRITELKSGDSYYGAGLCE